MTKRDFFKILIKLFGLYSSIQLLFNFIPQSIANLFLVKDIAYDLISLVIMILVGGIMYLLLFKADLIINAFKLDKGFDDEKFEIGSINNDVIVRFGLLIIAGFLILDNLPPFITNVFYAFRNSIGKNTMDQLSDSFYVQKTDYYSLITTGINLIIGYLMLTNMKNIARRINKIND